MSLLSLKWKKRISLLEIYLMITLVIASSILAADPPKIDFNNPDSYNNLQTWNQLKGNYGSVPWESINYNTVPWDQIINDPSVPWEKVKQELVPNTIVSKIPVDNVDVLRLTDTQKQYLSEKQLWYNEGENLEKVGDITKLNQATVNAVLNKLIPGASKATFVLQGGVHYSRQDGLYFKDYKAPCPSLRQDIEFKCQLRLRGIAADVAAGFKGVISAVEKQLPDGSIAKGFVICDNDCKKVSGVAQSVDLVKKADGTLGVEITLTGGKKISLVQGGTDIYVDNIGNSVLISPDATKAIINGVEVTIHQGEKTKVIVKKDRLELQSGAAFKTGDEQGVLQGNVVGSVQFYFKSGTKEITRIEGKQAEMVYTPASPEFSSQKISGTFDAIIANTKASQVVLQGKESYFELGNEQRNDKIYGIEGEARTVFIQGKTLQAKGLDLADYMHIRGAYEFRREEAGKEFEQLGLMSAIDIQEEYEVTCNINDKSSCIQAAVQKKYRVSCATKDTCLFALDARLELLKKTYNSIPKNAVFVTQDGKEISSLGQGSIDAGKVLEGTLITQTFDPKDKGTMLFYDAGLKDTQPTIIVDHNDNNVKNLLETTTQQIDKKTGEVFTMNFLFDKTDGIVATKVSHQQLRNLNKNYDEYIFEGGLKIIPVSHKPEESIVSVVNDFSHAFISLTTSSFDKAANSFVSDAVLVQGEDGINEKVKQYVQFRAKILETARLTTQFTGEQYKPEDLARLQFTYDSLHALNDQFKGYLLGKIPDDKRLAVEKLIAGNEKVIEGKYDDALNVYQQINDPALNKMVQSKIADVLFEKGSYQEASDLIASLIQQYYPDGRGADTTMEVLLYKKAMALAKQGKNTEAQQLIIAVTQSDDEELAGQALVELAKTQFNQGKTDQALAAMKSAYKKLDAVNKDYATSLIPQMVQLAASGIDLEYQTGETAEEYIARVKAQVDDVASKLSQEGVSPIELNKITSTLLSQGSQNIVNGDIRETIVQAALEENQDLTSLAVASQHYASLGDEANAQKYNELYLTQLNELTRKEEFATDYSKQRSQAEILEAQLVVAPEDKVAALERALFNDPKNINILSELADIYQQQKDLSSKYKAREYLIKAETETKKQLVELGLTPEQIKELVDADNQKVDQIIALVEGLGVEIAGVSLPSKQDLEKQGLIDLKSRYGIDCGDLTIQGCKEKIKVVIASIKGLDAQAKVLGTTKKQLDQYLGQVSQQKKQQELAKQYNEAVKTLQDAVPPSEDSPEDYKQWYNEQLQRLAIGYSKGGFQGDKIALQIAAAHGIYYSGVQDIFGGKQGMAQRLAEFGDKDSLNLAAKVYFDADAKIQQELDKNSAFSNALKDQIINPGVESYNQVTFSQYQDLKSSNQRLGELLQGEKSELYIEREQEIEYLITKLAAQFGDMGKQSLFETVSAKPEILNAIQRTKVPTDQTYILIEQLKQQSLGLEAGKFGDVVELRDRIDAFKDTFKAMLVDKNYKTPEEKIAAFKELVGIYSKAGEYVVLDGVEVPVEAAGAIDLLKSELVKKMTLEDLQELDAAIYQSDYIDTLVAGINQKKMEYTKQKETADYLSQQSYNEINQYSADEKALLDVLEFRKTVAASVLTQTKLELETQLKAGEITSQEYQQRIQQLNNQADKHRDAVDSLVVDKISFAASFDPNTALKLTTESLNYLSSQGKEKVLRVILQQEDKVTAQYQDILDDLALEKAGLHVRDLNTLLQAIGMDPELKKQLSADQLQQLTEAKTNLENKVRSAVRDRLIELSQIEAVAGSSQAACLTRASSCTEEDLQKIYDQKQKLELDSQGAKYQAEIALEAAEAHLEQLEEHDAPDNEIDQQEKLIEALEKKVEHPYLALIEEKKAALEKIYARLDKEILQSLSDEHAHDMLFVPGDAEDELIEAHKSLSHDLAVTALTFAEQQKALDPVSGWTKDPEQALLSAQKIAIQTINKKLTDEVERDILQFDKDGFWAVREDEIDIEKNVLGGSQAKFKGAVSQIGMYLASSAAKPDQLVEAYYEGAIAAANNDLKLKKMFALDYLTKKMKVGGIFGHDGGAISALKALSTPIADQNAGHNKDINDINRIAAEINDLEQGYGQIKKIKAESGLNYDEIAGLRTEQDIASAYAFKGKSITQDEAVFVLKQIAQARDINGQNLFKPDTVKTDYVTDYQGSFKPVEISVFGNPINVDAFFTPQGVIEMEATSRVIGFVTSTGAKTLVAISQKTAAASATAGNVVTKTGLNIVSKTAALPLKAVHAITEGSLRFFNPFTYTQILEGAVEKVVGESTAANIFKFYVAEIGGEEILMPSLVKQSGRLAGTSHLDDGLDTLESVLGAKHTSLGVSNTKLTVSGERYASVDNSLTDVLSSKNIQSKSDAKPGEPSYEILASNKFGEPLAIQIYNVRGEPDQILAVKGSSFDTAKIKEGLVEVTDTKLEFNTKNSINVGGIEIKSSSDVGKQSIALLTSADINKYREKYEAVNAESGIKLHEVTATTADGGTVKGYFYNNDPAQGLIIQTTAEQVRKLPTITSLTVTSGAETGTVALDSKVTTTKESLKQALLAAASQDSLLENSLKSKKAPADFGDLIKAKFWKYQTPEEQGAEVMIEEILSKSKGSARELLVALRDEYGILTVDLESKVSHPVLDSMIEQAKKNLPVENKALDAQLKSVQDIKQDPSKLSSAHYALRKTIADMQKAQGLSQEKTLLVMEQVLNQQIESINELLVSEPEKPGPQPTVPAPSPVTPSTTPPTILPPPIQPVPPTQPVIPAAVVAPATKPEVQPSVTAPVIDPLVQQHITTLQTTDNIFSLNSAMDALVALTDRQGIEQAVEPLFAALGHSSPVMRQRAAKTVGELVQKGVIAPETALAKLEPLRKDPAQQVRITAVNTISNVEAIKAQRESSVVVGVEKEEPLVALQTTGTSGVAQDLAKEAQKSGLEKVIPITSGIVTTEAPVVAEEKPVEGEVPEIPSTEVVQEAGPPTTFSGRITLAVLTASAAIGSALGLKTEGALEIAVQTGSTFGLSGRNWLILGLSFVTAGLIALGILIFKYGSIGDGIETLRTKLIISRYNQNSDRFIRNRVLLRDLNRKGITHINNIDIDHLTDPTETAESKVAYELSILNLFTLDDITEQVYDALRLKHSDDNINARIHEILYDNNPTTRAVAAQELSTPRITRGLQLDENGYEAERYAVLGPLLGAALLDPDENVREVARNSLARLRVLPGFRTVIQRLLPTEFPKKDIYTIKIRISALISALYQADGIEERIFWLQSNLQNLKTNADVELVSASIYALTALADKLTDGQVEEIINSLRIILMSRKLVGIRYYAALFINRFSFTQTTEGNPLRHLSPEKAAEFIPLLEALETDMESLTPKEEYEVPRSNVIGIRQRLEQLQTLTPTSTLPPVARALAYLTSSITHEPTGLYSLQRLAAKKQEGLESTVDIIIAQMPLIVDDDSNVLIDTLQTYVDNGIITSEALAAKLQEPFDALSAGTKKTAFEEFIVTLKETRVVPVSVAPSETPGLLEKPEIPVAAPEAVEISDSFGAFLFTPIPTTPLPLDTEEVIVDDEATRKARIADVNKGLRSRGVPRPEELPSAAAPILAEAEVVAAAVPVDQTAGLTEQELAGIEELPPGEFTEVEPKLPSLRPGPGNIDEYIYRITKLDAELKAKDNPSDVVETVYDEGLNAIETLAEASRIAGAEKAIKPLLGIAANTKLTGIDAATRRKAIQTLHALRRLVWPAGSVEVLEGLTDPDVGAEVKAVLDDIKKAQIEVVTPPTPTPPLAAPPAKAPELTTADTFAALLTDLKSDSDIVAINAINQLASNPDSRAIQPLLDLTYSRTASLEVKKAAVAVLGSFEKLPWPQGTLARLAALVRNNELAQGAKDSLGLLGQEKVELAVEELIKIMDTKIRQDIIAVAIIAVAEVIEQLYSFEETDAAKDKLTEIVLDPQQYPRVKLAAYKALLKISRENGVFEIEIEAYNIGTKLLQQESAGTLPALETPVRPEVDIPPYELERPKPFEKLNRVVADLLRELTKNHQSTAAADGSTTYPAENFPQLDGYKVPTTPQSITGTIVPLLSSIQSAKDKAQLRLLVYPLIASIARDQRADQKQAKINLLNGIIAVDSSLKGFISAAAKDLGVTLGVGQQTGLYVDILNLQQADGTLTLKVQQAVAILSPAVKDSFAIETAVTQLANEGIGEKIKETVVTETGRPLQPDIETVRPVLEILGVTTIDQAVSKLKSALIASRSSEELSAALRGIVKLKDLPETDALNSELERIIKDENNLYHPLIRLQAYETLEQTAQHGGELLPIQPKISLLADRLKARESQLPPVPHPLVEDILLGIQAYIQSNQPPELAVKPNDVPAIRKMADELQPVVAAGKKEDLKLLVTPLLIAYASNEKHTAYISILNALILADPSLQSYIQQKARELRLTLTLVTVQTPSLPPVTSTIPPTPPPTVPPSAPAQSTTPSAPAPAPPSAPAKQTGQPSQASATLRTLPTDAKAEDRDTYEISISTGNEVEAIEALYKLAAVKNRYDIGFLLSRVSVGNIPAAVKVEIIKVLGDHYNDYEWPVDRMRHLWGQRNVPELKDAAIESFAKLSTTDLKELSEYAWFMLRGTEKIQFQIESISILKDTALLLSARNENIVGLKTKLRAIIEERFHDSKVHDAAQQALDAIDAAESGRSSEELGISTSPPEISEPGFDFGVDTNPFVDLTPPPTLPKKGGGGGFGGSGPAIVGIALAMGVSLIARLAGADELAEEIEQNGISGTTVRIILFGLFLTIVTIPVIGYVKDKYGTIANAYYAFRLNRVFKEKNKLYPEPKERIDRNVALLKELQNKKLASASDDDIKDYESKARPAAALGNNIDEYLYLVELYSAGKISSQVLRRLLPESTNPAIQTGIKDLDSRDPHEQYSAIRTLESTQSNHQDHSLVAAHLLLTALADTSDSMRSSAARVFQAQNMQGVLPKIIQFFADAETGRLPGAERRYEFIGNVVTHDNNYDFAALKPQLIAAAADTTKSMNERVATLRALDYLGLSADELQQIYPFIKEIVTSGTGGQINAVIIFVGRNSILSNLSEGQVHELLSLSLTQFKDKGSLDLALLLSLLIGRAGNTDETQRIIPELITLLNQGQPVENLLYILGSMLNIQGIEAVVLEFEPLTTTDDKTVLKALIGLVNQLHQVQGMDRYIPFLIEQLDHKDGHVRQLAGYALTEYAGFTQANNALSKLDDLRKNDQDEYAKSAAERAYTAITGRHNAGTQVGPTTPQTTPSFGPQIPTSEGPVKQDRDSLYRTIETGNPADAVNALVDLASDKESRDIDVLLSMLKNNRILPRVKRAIIRVLGRDYREFSWSDEQLREIMRFAAIPSLGQTVLQAVNDLGHEKKTTMVTLLTTKLSDQTQNIRINAASILQALAPFAETDAAKDALQARINKADEVKQVRDAATAALNAINTRQPFIASDVGLPTRRQPAPSSQTPQGQVRLIVAIAGVKAEDGNVNPQMTAAITTLTSGNVYEAALQLSQTITQPAVPSPQAPQGAAPVTTPSPAAQPVSHDASQLKTKQEQHDVARLNQLRNTGYRSVVDALHAFDVAEISSYFTAEEVAELERLIGSKNRDAILTSDEIVLLEYHTRTKGDIQIPKLFGIDKEKTAALKRKLQSAGIYSINGIVAQLNHQLTGIPLEQRRQIKKLVGGTGATLTLEDILKFNLYRRAHGIVVEDDRIDERKEGSHYQKTRVSELQQRQLTSLEAVLGTESYVALLETPLFRSPSALDEMLPGKTAITVDAIQTILETHIHHAQQREHDDQYHLAIQALEHYLGLGLEYGRDIVYAQLSQYYNTLGMQEVSSHYEELSKKAAPTQEAIRAIAPRQPYTEKPFDNERTITGIEPEADLEPIAEDSKESDKLEAYGLTLNPGQISLGIEKITLNDRWYNRLGRWLIARVGIKTPEYTVTINAHPSVFDKEGKAARRLKRIAENLVRLEEINGKEDPTLLGLTKPGNKWSVEEAEETLNKAAPTKLRSVFSGWGKSALIVGGLFVADYILPGIMSAFGMDASTWYAKTAGVEGSLESVGSAALGKTLLGHILGGNYVVLSIIALTAASFSVGNILAFGFLALLGNVIGFTSGKILLIAGARVMVGPILKWLAGKISKKTIRKTPAYTIQVRTSKQNMANDKENKIKEKFSTWFIPFRTRRFSFRTGQFSEEGVQFDNAQVPVLGADQLALEVNRQLVLRDTIDPRTLPGLRVGKKVRPVQTEPPTKWINWMSKFRILGSRSILLPILALTGLLFTKSDSRFVLLEETLPVEDKIEQVKPKTIQPRSAEQETKRAFERRGIEQSTALLAQNEIQEKITQSQSDEITNAEKIPLLEKVVRIATEMLADSSVSEGDRTYFKAQRKYAEDKLAALKETTPAAESPAKTEPQAPAKAKPTAKPAEEKPDFEAPTVKPKAPPKAKPKPAEDKPDFSKAGVQDVDVEVAQVQPVLSQPVKNTIGAVTAGLVGLGILLAPAGAAASTGAGGVAAAGASTGVWTTIVAVASNPVTWIVVGALAIGGGIWWWLNRKIAKSSTSITETEAKQLALSVLKLKKNDQGFLSANFGPKAPGDKHLTDKEVSDLTALPSPILRLQYLLTHGFSVNDVAIRAGGLPAVAISEGEDGEEVDETADRASRQQRINKLVAPLLDGYSNVYGISPDVAPQIIHDLALADDPNSVLDILEKNKIIRDRQVSILGALINADLITLSRDELYLQLYDMSLDELASNFRDLPSGILSELLRQPPVNRLLFLERKSSYQLLGIYLFANRRDQLPVSLEMLAKTISDGMPFEDGLLNQRKLQQRLENKQLRFGDRFYVGYVDQSEILPEGAETAVTSIVYAKTWMTYYGGTDFVDDNGNKIPLSKIAYAEQYGRISLFKRIFSKYNPYAVILKIGLVALSVLGVLIIWIIAAPRRIDLPSSKTAVVDVSVTVDSPSSLADNVIGGQLTQDEFEKALDYLQKRFKAYPRGFLSVHLKNIKLLKNIRLNGQSAGGFQSGDTFYVDYNSLFTDNNIIYSVLDHELSHAVVRERLAMLYYYGTEPEFAGQSKQTIIHNLLELVKKLGTGNSAVLLYDVLNDGTILDTVSVYYTLSDGTVQKASYTSEIIQELTDAGYEIDDLTQFIDNAETAAANELWKNSLKGGLWIEANPHQQDDYVASWPYNGYGSFFIDERLDTFFSAYGKNGLLDDIATASESMFQNLYLATLRGLKHPALGKKLELLKNIYMRSSSLLIDEQDIETMMIESARKLVPNLVAKYENQGSEVLREALLTPSEYIPALIESALDRSNPDVQANAIQALGLLQTREAVAELLELLDSDDTDQETKRLVIEALGRIGSNYYANQYLTIEALIDLLGGTHTAEVAIALGRIGDFSALYPLSQAMASAENEQQRTAIAAALSAMPFDLADADETLLVSSLETYDQLHGGQLAELRKLKQRPEILFTHHPQLTDEQKVMLLKLGITASDSARYDAA
ncbi:HEAT repeat domain-containing protein [Candidatus Woesearchaeota archaeon]|nr:HEAT repeat domain-containing protein [Candidatus Woesearchaeota archaeon]